MRYCSAICVLLLLAGGLAVAADQPSPLLFHAAYDGTLTARDEAGAVEPVEVTGKVEYRPGKAGQALLCGGDAANVKYPVAQHVRPTQGTVEMWAQAVDWPADEQAFHVLFETEGPGWLVLYKFYTGGWLMLTGIDHGHYTSAFAEQQSVQNAEWHHWAGTWAKEKQAVYMDGKLLKDTPLPALPPELQGWFRIGDDGWLKPHTSHTLIDEVKVWRWALPADQIALAAQGQPVTYRPPLAIQVEPRPSRDEWKVTVDASGFTDNPQAQAAISILSGSKATSTGATGVLRDGVGTAVLSVAQVPAGPQTVRAVVLDGTGAEITRGEIAYEKPARPPWLGNKIGMVDRVLPGFTAMTVGGKPAKSFAPADRSVECWGRKYQMNAPFPTQIESQQAKLLAQPIRLAATTAAGPVAWQTTSTRLTGCSDTRVTQTAVAEAPQAKLTTASTIEYDGMLWTDVTITPKAPLDLTELTLEMPLDAKYARYIHHVRPSWGEDTAGNLPEAGYSAVGFQPYLWLGDDDRGLSWFCESQKGWVITSDKPAIEARRNGDVVNVRIHIISAPTHLDRPLQLSFGLQATPAKARPADARTWRLGNLGSVGYMDQPSMGTIQVLWSNGNLQFYGWPVPKDAAAFRKTVDDLHAKGVRAVPYINLNFMANGAAEWAYYSSDFRDPGRAFTTGDVAQMGSALIGACPNSAAWRDLISYKLAQFVDEYHVDGIYVDCWNPLCCLQEDHGCGWRDAQGNLQGTYPIRASREIVRRVRELLADRRPNPHIIIHMSTSVVMPMLAFADSMLDGEQYQGPLAPKDDYLGVVPLDKWRAENTGLQWGVVPFFLPEFSGPNQRIDLPTHRLMGLMLAHDCSPWPIWCKSQVIFDAWKAADAFGIQTAELRPYWKPNGVTTDSGDAVVSVYSQPKSALLVILNSATTDQPVKVSLDAKALGVPAGMTAEDAASHEKLAVEGGAMTVTVPARDFRMIVVK